MSSRHAAEGPTQVELDFPAAAAVIGLYMQPTPGWQFRTTISTLPKPVEPPCWAS
jgi:hypothetical protein